MPRSNLAVEPVSIDDRGIHRAVARCGACNRRAFDVIGVPADVRVSTRDRFASLGVERRCVCRLISVARVAVRPGQPPPDGLVGGWRCACGHFLGSIEPVQGRIAAPCRRCGVSLSGVAAYLMATAQSDDLARAS